MAEEIIAGRADTSPTVEAKTDNTPPTDSITKVREFESLKSLFDVGDPSAKTNEYMQKIWDYAKENATNKDKESIIFEVIRLKNKLGSPNIGESMFTRIINYISVYNRHKQDEMLLHEMKRE